jgi:hypothetical protein
MAGLFQIPGAKPRHGANHSTLRFTGDRVTEYITRIFATTIDVLRVSSQNML